MESALTWKHATLINELTQGMEKAKQLRFHLCTTSPSSKAQDLLLHKILSSYEKALYILKSNGSTTQQSQSVTPNSRFPESSVSVDGSPKCQELNRAADTTPPKKRKKQATWTEQVRINSEIGLEGPTDDDGYGWRKYGQKDILGAKYPRSYYKCTYHLLQNCLATKQVQRSDNDPTVFEITYKGKHTCCNQSNHLNTSAIQPSHEKQEPEHENQTLVDLRANLRVDTEDLANKEVPAHFSFPECHDAENCYFPNYGFVDDNQMGMHSPLFYSPPDTSESNYFCAPTYQMNNYEQNGNFQHSTSDIAEIISAHASTTNSPIAGMEFSPFDNSGFFT